MSEVLRRDGRSLLQLRGKQLKTQYAAKCDGSAFYSQGHTAIVVTVNGPLASYRSDVEDYHRCVVEVSVLRASATPAAGGATRDLVQSLRNREEGSDAQLAALVERCVTSVVLCESFPRCVLQITVDVVKDDGSLLAAVINGTMCALLDAGVPCRTTMATTTILLLRGPKSRLMLDPTLEEEQLVTSSSASAVLHTAVHPLQCSVGTLAFTLVGRSTMDELRQLDDASARASGVLFEFFRNCSAPVVDEDAEASL